MEITRQTKKREVLKLAEKCDRCGHCCSHTSGFILAGEIKKIAEYLGISQDELKRQYLKETDIYNKTLYRPKRLGEVYGACIFFEEGCTIHSVKPLFCMISTCRSEGDSTSHWFMVNYVVDETDPESIRQWNQAVRLNGTIKGAAPHEIVEDKELLEKMLNYGVLK